MRAGTSRWKQYSWVTKYYKKSAITYLQFGDGVKSYENKSVRLLLKIIDWVTKETKN